MKKTLKKLTAFLTSVLMCGVSLLDFPAGSFNISLPSWAADEGGGIYVCDHAYINGFCISCEAYQPAVQVSDKYDLDGDGATESVYEIGNAGQLYWFAKFVNEGNGNEESEAVLTDDISVNANVINENGELNSGSFRNWTPIANKPVCSFNGFFDGQNHEISGLYCVDLNDMPIGLFGITVGYGRSISNVKLVDSYFSGTGYSGGICGASNHDIKNCYNESTVIGKSGVGGICGMTQNNNVENCGNSGRIIGEKNIGGIYGCGDLNYSVTNCFNNGIISGESQAGEIGGITSGGSLKDCCYNSEINGLEVIGLGAETATMDNVVGKTAAELESGEAAYFLGDSWGQNLDNGETKQDLPVLGGAKVYQIEKYSKCDKSDTPVTAYSNTDKTQVAEHIIENGFCVNCDYLQPAVMNSNYKYEIGNAGQLYWFAKFTNESEDNSYFSAILTSDIVVNENVLNDDMVPNEGTYRQWTPIGKKYDYKGTFDGNNHTISGLYYNDSSYCKTLGFICTAEYSEIKNLGIVDSYFYVNIGTRYTGGICGNSNGNIINCFSICQIEGDSGYSSNCGYGGICGILNGDYLINCYSLSSLVKNSGYYSGKICGMEWGRVDNCYYDSETINTRGGRTIEEFENGTVAYLLAKGSDYYPGENSWGQNLDNDEPKQKYPSLGGAKVYEVKKYSKCDKSDTPVTVYSNTDKEQVPAHVIENGFCKNCDYLQPAVMNSENQYEIGNAGQLYWFAGLVNGTLDGVEQNTLANAILTANITVNENLLDSLQYDTEGNVSNGSDFITWTPIADCMEDHITQYSGTFDGNNKTVSGLYFNGDSTCIGLFGSSESDGNIKNVGVVDSYFKGNDSVGGVCGNNAGTITNCYNAGNLTAIESSATVGGICGYNNGGTVTNCYNTGTVTATGSVASVGGVCGCSIAPISNCYNIGTVTATSSGADISGICGYYFGPVTNCYYLADTEDENGGKTAEQFASGEVAYLLSRGCTVGEGEGENAVTYSGSVWGQNLATENYPVLNGETVYQVDSYEGCIGNPGNSTKVYSNTNAPIYVEHNYSSKGACTICGAFKNGIGEHLDGYSLSLDGNIGVNFFMELDKSVIADENAYMKFRLPNGKTSVVLVGDAKQQTVGGTTYYVFSCEVAAKEMNETITAQIITSDKKGGVYEYSVADYIQYIRDNPTEFDEKTLSLVNAMAGYGDYAKAYFNNENLDANTEMDAVTADTLAEYKMSESGELPEGITYYGSSLLLESKTVLRHYFKVEEGVDAESYGFSEHKGMYYYYDDELFARNLVDPSWNFRFNDYTLTYGPMSYSYAVLTNQSDDKALVNLMKSLYLYGKAASDYYFADAPFYLMPNSEWLEGNARFAVYAWNDAGNKWFDCADVGDGIHFVVKDFDFSYKNVIFCRMDPDKTENNWDSRLNATVKTVVPTGRNRYYRLDEGTSNNVGGSWISDTFLL